MSNFQSDFDFVRAQITSPAKPAPQGLADARALHASLLPNPALKGVKNGNCNRQACQRPGATWFNSSTRAYYCKKCAAKINYWSELDWNETICTEETV